MKRLVMCVAATAAFTAVVCALSLMLGASAPSVPSGNWAAIQADSSPPAASMTEARAGAAAVRLDDGRVLIAGGVNAYGTGPLASAEAFDGARFAAVGSMSVARRGHIAIKLGDGRVLVAGGTTSDGAATRSAEVFNPSRNTWSATGELATARAGHTATLLADGRVLIAGGTGSDDAGRTLELFDPASGGFRYAGAFLSNARGGHAAAALANGDVLLTGGADANGATATTDIFSAATGEVIAGPMMGAAREGHSATTMPDGTVLIAGGGNSGGDVASAELFVGTGFLHAGSLGEARRNHAAMLLPDNGQVLIVGGTSNESPAVSAELYRPWATGFVATGSPANVRDGAAGSTTVFAGLALIAGGVASSSAELYGFATLASDAGSYGAGSGVTLTGSGWEPGETVTVKVQSTTIARAEQLVFVVADKQGRISTSEFVPSGDDAGASFVATAEGARSQARAAFAVRASRIKMMESSASSSMPTLAPPPGTPGPLVWTSKDDYVPGELVDMWGSGWLPDEEIHLILTELPAEHSPRSFSVFADGLGAFEFSQFRPEEHHAGVQFRLQAIGVTSGSRAETTFWDSVAQVGVPSSGTNGGGGASAELSLSSVALANGDVQIAQIVVNKDFQNRVICAPSGWISILRTPAGSAVYLQQTFYRLGPAVAGTQTFVFKNIATNCGTAVGTESGFGAAGGLIIYSGVDTSGAGPIRSSAGTSNGTSSGPYRAPSVAANIGDRVIRFFSAEKNLNITPPSRLYIARASNTSERTAVAFDAEHTAGATTDTFDATFPSSSEWTAQTVVLKMAMTGPTKLAFTTGAHTGTVHSCVGPIDVQTQNASNAPTNVTSNTAVNLGSDGTGTFHTVAGCGSGPITSVEITTGNNTATVYYRATTRGDGSHNLTASATGLDSASQEQTINRIAVTAQITASNKVYDGNTDATVTCSLPGVQGGDDAGCDADDASFATKDVGSGKTVEADVSLIGDDADNYELSATTAQTTASITALEVTGSFTADDKVYDGNPSATVLARDLTGEVVADDVQLTGGTATFDTKNVGTDKTVTLTGATLSGDDAGNYTLSSVDATTADISPLGVTGSFTAQSKTYDGTMTATVLTRTVNGAITGDTVSLSGGTATFDTKNVGTGKTVTLSGATLAGTDAGNYTLNSVGTTTANIIALGISGSFTADNKTYDGTPAATVLTRTLNGSISGDNVALNGGTASFDTKNVGTGKTVTLNGATLTGGDAGNYSLTSVATTTADISALGITGSFTADGKTYDGTTAATVLTRALNGAISGDDVTLNGGTAAFDNKNVGTGKTVALSGATLGGTDAGNYSLNSVATTTADISPLGITGSFTADNKAYDGTTAAAVVTRTLNGTITGDDVELTGGTATFETKNVGMGKTVTLSGATLAGGDASNYSLNSVATTTADISPLGITGSFKADNKTYDGTTAATVSTRTLSGTIAGDDVAFTGGTATFETKDVGTGKTVTLSGATLAGGDAGNYSLNSVATTTADISPLGITGSFTADSKAYDGTTAATVLTRTLNGAITGDDVALTGGTATFDTKNVGTGKTVTLSGATVAGGEAGNYSLNSVATTTADILALGISGSFTADNKTYDGTTSATVLTRSLTGTISGDIVTLDGGTATFENKNVGTGKTVTLSGATLLGADAGNYSLNSVAATTADILALGITGSFTADNKTYDGTTAATVLTGTLNGAISGDIVSLSGGTATFDNKTVGTGKTVTLSGATLAGTHAGNYTLNSVGTATANVIAKLVTAGIVAAHKTYDATTNATIIDCSVTGTVPGDNLDCSATNGQFATADAGLGIQVSAAVALIGSDALNYTLASPTPATTANINKANPTIIVQGFTGTFDGNAHGVTGSATGVLGESLSGLDLGASFTFVPGGIAVWTFTDVTGNYNDATGKVEIVILTACSVFNGFHAPIGGSEQTGGGGTFTDPARAFKLGSTVPIKFNATCFGVPLTTGAQKLQAIKYSSATSSDTPIDATPSDAATAGNEFKLTGTDWHFNMATKSLGTGAQGKWLLKATLFDGSTYTVWIEIKK